MLQIPQRLAIDLYDRSLEQKRCRPVELEDCAAIPELVKDMIVFARSHNGVGLAAPQVGIYIRLAIVLTTPSIPLLLINPEINNLSGRDLLAEEACLSIPPSGNSARVWRSEFVEIKTGSLDDPHERTTTLHSAFEARVIQHEIDHLDGIFFINRCGPVAKQLVLGKYHKLTRRAQEKWPLSRQP